MFTSGMREDNLAEIDLPGHKIEIEIELIILTSNWIGIDRFGYAIVEAVARVSLHRQYRRFTRICWLEIITITIFDFVLVFMIIFL